MSPSQSGSATPPFRKLLVANRSEIAIRVIRAAYELDIETVAVFSGEDRLSLHRFKAHEAYQVGAGKSPVEAYLDIPGMLEIARQTGCDAVHPGYGFLSENAELARACEAHGITFVGPTPEQLEAFGDKTSAKALAAQATVHESRGASDEALACWDEALRRAAAGIKRNTPSTW